MSDNLSLEGTGLMRREPDGSKINEKKELLKETKLIRSEAGIVTINNDINLGMCEGVSSEEPIPDVRVENFMMDIVENGLIGVDALYCAYKKCNFVMEGTSTYDKNQMRVLLRHPRVKARLKFLKDCEFELTRVDARYISTKLKDIVEDDEVRVADRLTAINSLAKVSGVDGSVQQNQTSGVSIIFNCMETPKEIKNVTPRN